MKKVLKSRIFLVLITALIFSGIGGVVAYNYSAKDIAYTPSDTSWNVNSVETAIDSLKNDNDRKYNERVAELERQYQNALSQVQNSGGNKIIFLSSSWKAGKNWNNYGFSSNLIVDGNYVTFGSNTVTFSKNCNVRINVFMYNSDANSATPQFQLVHNNVVVFSGSNGKGSNATSVKSININAKANDTIYMKMYGGGEATFYITYIEPIN